ncbi:putative PPE family protein PPE42 [Mycobacterium basiliense]|uniref:Putative PPE family protein PPE42 n=1 Tax=Mycobacterium basiliense TaxID=2094119 RepID=A0A447GBP8_9MYCO|nr:PPE family protein [Mycobacterium basiliense]VDM87892.1 putative PPE family protein PPE42 [Mycobacterium basiliense]
MNFATLPPEVNSERLFGGPGPGPVLAAATGWAELATELRSGASGFLSVVSGLADRAWQGSASMAMTAAAARHIDWLSVAGAHAEQAAEQANAAARAFEAARAATVHPGLVASNRGQLVSLARSNLFGQNAPAIAAAEAQYEQMWAQDVAAMLDYHAGASAIAAALTPLRLTALSPAGARAAAETVLGSSSINLNLGFANIGNGNVGAANRGDFNLGLGNVGGGNVGHGNVGGFNVGSANLGSFNVGPGNVGDYHIGAANVGRYMV